MNQLKRQVLPPGLWVVATPIGNLADLSDRARQALSQAHTVLCEDTRRTAQLFTALGLGRPTGGFERLDAHASAAKIHKILEELEEVVANAAANAAEAESGSGFALVTDAGTPGVSDPGAKFVQAARGAGLVVTPISGASAVMTLLSVSGFEESSFVFRGFFPRKDSEREKEWGLVEKGSLQDAIWIWFESPERVVSALEWVAEKCPRARVIAAKELTKIHEQFFTGESFLVAGEVIKEVEKEGARGEWCFALVLPRNDEEKAAITGESSEWLKALSCLSEAGVSASVAAKSVSRNFGVPKNRVYEEALKIFQKK